jgi:hypothetical protein
MSNQSSEAAVGQGFKKMNTLVTDEDVAKLVHLRLASIRRWRLEPRGHSS